MTNGLLARFVTVLWVTIFRAGSLQYATGILHLVIQIWPHCKKEPIPDGIGSFLELLARFELATSSLPRMRSTG